MDITEQGQKEQENYDNLAADASFRVINELPPSSIAGVFFLRWTFSDTFTIERISGAEWEVLDGHFDKNIRGRLWTVKIGAVEKKD